MVGSSRGLLTLLPQNCCLQKAAVAFKFSGKVILKANTKKEGTECREGTTGSEGCKQPISFNIVYSFFCVKKCGGGGTKGEDLSGLWAGPESQIYILAVYMIERIFSLMGFFPRSRRAHQYDATTFADPPPQKTVTLQYHFLHHFVGFSNELLKRAQWGPSGSFNYLVHIH